jgi:vesicle coat complex subunit
LHVDQETSNNLVCQIASGDLILKPGWIRMSIHPTTTSEEIQMVCDSIKELAQNHKEWAKDYSYNSKTNEFDFNGNVSNDHDFVEELFKF